MRMHWERLLLSHLLGNFRGGEPRRGLPIGEGAVEHELALPLVQDAVQVDSWHHISEHHREALLCAQRPLELLQRVACCSLAQQGPWQPCSAHLPHAGHMLEGSFVTQGSCIARILFLRGDVRLQMRWLYS